MIEKSEEALQDVGRATIFFRLSDVERFQYIKRNLMQRPPSY